MAALRRRVKIIKTSDKRCLNKNQENKKVDSKNCLEVFRKFSPPCSIVFPLIMALACSWLHWRHLSNMFEKDKHFSHLSTLERELSFRTEMGLYYSYFKTMVSATTWPEGMHAIMFDNLTEFPATINTLKRFNLYPEVVLGSIFRFLNHSNWLNKVCYNIQREAHSSIVSCEGFGEPAVFYSESVFLLNGLMMGAFFFTGTLISGSFLGGAIAVTSYFYNHSECTRVQWSPPLRECFAYPVLVLQMLILTHLLRSEKVSRWVVGWLAGVTAVFMACWQFAQFVLLTQLLAVFGCFVLQSLSHHQMKAYLSAQMVGFLIGFLLLFGNEMLLTSFFAPSLLSAWVVVGVDSLLIKRNVSCSARKVQELLLMLFGSFVMKILIGQCFTDKDDLHIIDILLSKFLDHKNFHTMLYTCAKEFDFLELKTFWILSKTLLLPSACLSSLLIGFQMVKSLIGGQKSLIKESQPPCVDGHLIGGHGSLITRSQLSVNRDKPPKAEMVYHAIQLLAFSAMALMVMRLKLFWTPQLCLVASLLASKELLFVCPGYNKRVHYFVLVILIGCMSVVGYGNLRSQFGILGEFSNYPQEELINWIKFSTPADAVFAGPMPVMATVKLTTGRPIVNHPHYENSALRQRVKDVYTLYSRKPAVDVRATLRKLYAQYVVLERSWCFGSQKPGCSMPEIWDIEDSGNRGRPSTCATLLQNPSPYFTRVFRNTAYDVLIINP